MQKPVEQNRLWSNNPRLIILFLIFSLVLIVLAIKGFSERWFAPRYPLDLHQQPAILFFNRHNGCQCTQVIYRAAANQAKYWPEENRKGVQLINIDLDERPDLGEQFGIVRAPTLMLLDQTGKIIYKQDEVLTDAVPLNLPVIEGKIAEVLNGE